MDLHVEDEQQRNAQLRYEVQKGLDDLEGGRFTEVNNEEALRALFGDIKRRAQARLTRPGHDVQAP